MWQSYYISDAAQFLSFKTKSTSDTTNMCVSLLVEESSKKENFGGRLEEKQYECQPGQGKSLQKMFTKISLQAQDMPGFLQ